MKRQKKSYLRYLIYFLIFSALGSFIEFSYGGRWYDQAIFILFNFKIPFIPLYGLGCILLVLIENKMERTNTKFIFRGIINGIATTALELVSGILTFAVFNQYFWDYSDHFANFLGIISLKISLAWIFLGYVFSLIYQRFIRKYENV